MKYTLAEAANAELDHYLDYTANDQSLDAAIRLYNKIYGALDLICENPERWPIHLDEIRRYSVPRSRYSIFYRMIDNREVYVVAIMHGSRRPGYWRRRLDDLHPRM